MDSDTGEVGYFRSGGDVWLLAIARVLPQEKLPAGLADADVPRLVIGYRVTAERLGDIAGRFNIGNVNVGSVPVPGAQGLALAIEGGCNVRT